MKKLLVLLFCLLPTLAFAQSQRNPCYNTGSPGNCVPVGTSTPLPVTSLTTPSSNFATSQVVVAITNTATVAARAGRQSVIITNITGTQPIYCSGSVATTSNGQYIPAVAGANLTISTSAAINCIAVTAPQTVSVAEAY